MKQPNWIRVYRSQALVKQGRRCAYCRCPLTHSQATADHIQPIAQGGTDNQSNIAAACATCNVAKGRMSAKMFKRVLRNHKSFTGWRVMDYAAQSRRFWLEVDRACNRIIASTLPPGRPIQGEVRAGPASGEKQ